MVRTIWDVAALARKVRPGPTTLVRHLFAAACVLLFAARAFAAPSYTLTFQPNGVPAAYNVTQSTPLQHVDAFPVALNGLGSSSFTGSGFAYPGHVGVQDRLETHWTGISAGSRCDVDSKATATDFVITGPAGPPVTGQLHLRVRAKLEHVGGYASNASHTARVNVDVRAKFAAFAAIGDLTSSNLDTHGTGIMAGLTSPELDFAFVLSGTFSVGVPFDVTMRLTTMEITYGNGGVTPNPGYVLGDGASRPDYGLFLEEVGGQVITLPAGYTLNSVSWGVVDNHFQSIVGVGSEPRRDELRLATYPNPCIGAATVTFEQPQAAHVRVQIFDVGGRLVRTLANEWHVAGAQRLEWDGRTDKGSVAGAGLYFLRAEVGGSSSSARIVRVLTGR